MKKLVLVAAIMMFVPFSAFALDTMDDDSLDKVTAQEGVTITFDNVVIKQTPADVAWSDSDGITEASNQGRVYVAYGTSGSDTITITQDLTIDVATTTTALIVDAGADTAAGATADDSVIPATTSFVKVGLPSVSSKAEAKTMTISMDNSNANIVGSAAEPLGTLFQNGGSSSISGSIYIYAH